MTRLFISVFLVCQSRLSFSQSPLLPAEIAALNAIVLRDVPLERVLFVPVEKGGGRIEYQVSSASIKYQDQVDEPNYPEKTIKQYSNKAIKQYSHKTGTKERVLWSR